MSQSSSVNCKNEKSLNGVGNSKKPQIYRKTSLPTLVRPSPLFLSHAVLPCELSRSFDDIHNASESALEEEGLMTSKYWNSLGISEPSLDLDDVRSKSSLKLTTVHSVKSLDIKTLNRLDGVNRGDLGISQKPIDNLLVQSVKKPPKVNTEQLQGFLMTKDRQRAISNASQYSELFLEVIKYHLVLNDPEVNEILNQSLEPQKVLVYLTQQGVINWSDDITKMLNVPREVRIQKLLTILQSLSGQWWDPFIKAVRSSEQNNVADVLQKKLAEIEDALQFKGVDLTVTNKLQIVLKTRYLQDRRILTSQWRNFMRCKIKEFHLLTDYTELELVPDASFNNTSTSNLQTKSLLTILKEAKQINHRFVLEGEPGMGKSTIASTIVTEWAKNTGELGYWLNQQYELIFLIRLGEVAEGTDLTQSISLQFGESSFQVDIDDFLSNEDHRFRTLLILDGFDEFSAMDECEEFLDIIRGDLYSEMSTIITTRPIHTSTLMDSAQFRTVVRCNGLSKESTHEYFYRNLPQQTFLLSDAQARELFRNPLFLDIYRASGTVRNDVELFYIIRHLTQTILQRHFKKTHKLHSEDVDLHRQLMNFLSAEAFRIYNPDAQYKPKPTLKTLFSKLTKGSQSNEQLSDLAFRTGLLFHPRKKQREGLEITASMFPHNLFLQYFAARHAMLSLQLTIQSSDYTKLDPFYLYFCSGFSQRVRAKGAWWSFDDYVLTCRWIAALPLVRRGVTDKAIRWMSELRGTDSLLHQIPWVRRIREFVNRNGPLQNLTGKYVIKNCYFGPELAELCAAGFLNSRQLTLWKCVLPGFVDIKFRTLYKLELAFCSFCNTSYRLLIDFLEANKDTLIVISLWGSKGWIEHRDLHPRFLQVLRSSKVQDLDLSGCQLDLHFIKLLADALPDCPSFNSLQVSGNSAIWQEGTDMKISTRFLEAVKYSEVRGLSLNKWVNSKPICSEFIDNFVHINTFNESLTQVQVGGHRSFDDRKDFFNCLCTMTSLKEVLCSRSCKNFVQPLKDKGIRVMHAY